VIADNRFPMAPGPAVTVQRDGAVAVVTLARPAKANAMDGEITDALLETVRTLSHDRSVHAMVLTGDGSAFSAGGDVETIRAMRDDRTVRGTVLGAHQDLFWTMTRLPFATVAAVNGPAVGAGVTVALLCDLVVMAQDAFLSDPRVSLGLLDGAGGIVLWPLLTSLSAAKEFLLLGDRVTGAEAHRLGLVNRTVPTAETLAESLRLAHRLAELPAPAVREMRRLLNSHIERAATVLDECARAEIACFDTAEHGVLLEQLSAKVAARTGGSHGGR
jgi:enoyl-CoA hydratase